MKPIYTQKFTLSHIHTDRFGLARPSALLYFIQEAAGEHSALLTAGSAQLSQKALFWAVTRTRVQITHLPRLGQTITVETWPMPTTRVAYPRSVVAYDEAGQELFRAISLWVLMDSRTRGMILPGKSGVVVEGALVGGELDTPHALAVRPMEHSVTCRVGYTLLDQNGHMNNTRYMDWLDDLLPSDFHRTHPAREFTLCYLSEAREGEEISLHYTLEQGSVLTADARRGAGDEADRIFSAQIIF